VLSSTDRLHFAEQIPQLAKSQTESPLEWDNGIQEKGSSQAELTGQRNRNPSD
jgi:hypothetical protein